MIGVLADHPWLGMLGEVLALAALMVSLRALQRRVSLSPEASRKLFHVGGGLSTLAFPWLFHSAWPVLALAPLTIGSLLALKHLRRLRYGLGAVLYGIERRSLGEVYMPLSLTLVWVASGGNALLYGVPALVLTCADPAAALIGARYGRRHYTGVEGEKSLEGSLVFALIAACCALIPLLAVGHIDATRALLVALALAVVTTVAEAVAWHGLDNLLIPAVSLVALRVFLLLPMLGLSIVLVVAGTVAALGYVWRHRVARRARPSSAATIGTYLRVLLAGR